MSTLGLDIGTTGCKAVTFDSTGRQLAHAYREYPLLMPKPGWMELNSKLVLKACMEVVSEAAGTTKEAVRAIGVSCQGEAFTPVSADGTILGNAMVSSDMRAVDQVAALTKYFGAKVLYEKTGHTPHPMFSLFKLAWLRDNRPDLWQRSARFLCFEDLFAHQLGLEPTMGYSLAGRTMLFDVLRHVWDSDILASLKISSEQLGHPSPSGTIVGHISDDITRNLNLAPGAVLIAGGHDQPCAALGAGVIEPGVAMYALGTVECITPAFAQPIFTEELFSGNLCTYDYTLNNMYTTVAFSLTGGNLLKWYRDEWFDAGRKQNGDVYDNIIATMSAEPPPLLVLPYFTSSGTPYFDTKTPGIIIGLRLSTTRAQVLRALLEGIALEMRLNLDILKNAGVFIHELRAVGGGACNPALLQLKADVLNQPIARIVTTEAGCLGTAMLAYAAIESIRVEELISTWVKPLETLSPNTGTIDHYNRQFETYRHLQPTLAELELNNNGEEQ